MIRKPELLKGRSNQRSVSNDPLTGFEGIPHYLVQANVEILTEF